MEKKELFVRILILSFFVLLLNTWLQAHVKSSLYQLVITNGLLFIFAIFSFFAKLRKKSEQDSLSDVVLNWINLLISTPVLITLYFLMFVFSCFFTSFTITSVGQIDKVEVNLLNPKNSEVIKSGKIGSNTEQLFFTLTTSPFGKQYKIRADGYQDYNIRVYPWLGKVLCLEEDLKISPTLFLRVLKNDFKHTNKTRIVIQHNDSLFNYPLKNGKKLIKIGQDIQLPNNYFDNWNIELRSEYQDEQIVYNILNAWWNQEPLFIPLDLSPGKRIKIGLWIDEESGTEYATYEGVISDAKHQELKKLMN